LIPLFLDQRLLAFQALFTFMNQLVKKIKHLKLFDINKTPDKAFKISEGFLSSKILGK